MPSTRTAFCLAAAGLTLSATVALADDAPRTTATSKSLFMAQEGCGSTAEPGRLEPKPQADSADGCGTIGGLPLNEVAHQDEEDLGPTAEDYTSTSKLVPFVVDASKKVKGQVAAESWFGAGGVGSVTWDVSLRGTTAAGKIVDFGTTTVSADAAPGENDVFAPFELAIPRAASGQTFKRFVVSVALRGQNIGMSAKKLSGDSYVVIPAKAPVPPKRRR